MDFREFLKNNNVILDGATGTELQKAGLQVGELPERWNITHPDVLVNLHKAYYDAGANVVSANTFGANILRYNEEELEAVVKAAIDNVKKARELSIGKQEKFVAVDIGPTGKLLEPYGDLKFEEAVEVFAKTVRLVEKYGADLIFIQTMNDAYETKSAVLAVKENSSLPVFVTNAYNEDSKLMTGATPYSMACMLEGLGVDGIGANCSFGPKDLEDVIEKLLEVSSLPVIFMPNAGMPKSVDGKTVYDVTAEDFASSVADMVSKGVRVAGGCCGTTPKYIELLSSLIKDKPVSKVTYKGLTHISSNSKEVRFGSRPLIIGERINPTGKKRFKQALIENDIGYILQEGISQSECGADVLDVNVGIPDINEVEVLPNTVTRLQEIIDLPLQIDTSNKDAMEKALRIYNGKALINSVNGKKESMEAVFPLAKKYGGAIIALTLDENGIPQTPEGRFEIALKILREAEKYGIKKEDLIFDTLCMTMSVDPEAGTKTVNALKLIKEKTGCNTSLGISNVSFGLPDRESINAAFLSMALDSGLNAAIMNPFSKPVMEVMCSYNSENGTKEDIEKYQGFIKNIINRTIENSTNGVVAKTLSDAIIRGLKDESKVKTEELLKTKSALDIINNEVIPALDEVGKGYENKTIYLPQLLLSAEAAKQAFNVIKDGSTVQNSSVKCTFVIATVFGDIHDIGKNIVKLLLENYGFNVIDLGKDVPPKVIVDEVVKTHAPLCGLSALMTTTVPAMEDTIKLLRERAPWCKVVVGGAVLTEEYARKIGADKYAKDAMETVRYSEEIFNKLGK